MSYDKMPKQVLTLMTDRSKGTQFNHVRIASVQCEMASPSDVPVPIKAPVTDSTSDTGKMAAKYVRHVTGLLIRTTFGCDMTVLRKSQDSQ